jgi:hypothetical protein
LALVCGFKATSDLPQWLNHDERERLKAFLVAEPRINQLSRNVFKVDGRTVDFGCAIPLPERPWGYTAIKANIFGWLANRKWALKFNDAIQKDTLKKLIINL